MSFMKSDPFGAPPLWEFGPAPGQMYNFPGVPRTEPSPASDYFTHSKSPITVGASVIGLKFDKGVIIAADTLASYGSLLRFMNVERILKVNNNIILGAGGDFADFQYLKDIIEQKIIDEECLDDGFRLKPKALYCWLTRILYNRRSKFDPFWNNFVIAGLEDGTPFVGTVDKLGTAYMDDVVATGFGSYIATPILRDALEANKGKINKEQAIKLIHHCMEVLYYRDTRSFPKFEVACLTAEGVTTEQMKVNENWQIAHLIKGYK